MKKLIKSKELLFDGEESQELYSNVFSVNRFTFKVSELFHNEFVNIVKICSKEAVLTIAQHGKFRTSDFYKNYFKNFESEDFYQSEEGLSLYYCIHQGLLLVFSFGEKQPMRYQLYLESIWEL